MSQKLQQQLLAFSVSCMVASFSLAHANTQPLTADMQVFQIDQKQQKKLLKATDQVKPKQVLEYQVTYQNVSNNSLKNLKLNLPLPESVTYLGQSMPQGTYASLDGKKFTKAPLTRVLNGKTVHVPLSEYRVLQWSIAELKPKQKTQVSAQVRVNTSE